MAGCTKFGRPMMSADICEARRRARTLYRDLYRAIPFVLQRNDIPKNANDCRWKIRENFYKNAYITDMRIIDILVIKIITNDEPLCTLHAKFPTYAFFTQGYITLQELMETWAQKGHVFAHWNPTLEKKPCDFLSKFINEKV